MAWVHQLMPSQVGAGTQTPLSEHTGPIAAYAAPNPVLGHCNTFAPDRFVS
jgi:hypothetical protein